MEIKNESVVPLVEVKKILAQKEKEKELGYEQKVTLDFLKKFCKQSPAKAEKLAEELKGLGKLSEKAVVNILNFMPKDLDDMRVLLANERGELSTDDKNKVLELVKAAEE